jgi:hypothetical protein
MSTRTPMHPSRHFPAMHAPVVAGALLVAVAACLPDDATLDVPALGAPDLIELIDLTPISPAGDLWNDCSTWDCNKNHPELTGFPIPELNENGLPAELGMRIVSFRSASNQSFKFDVTRGEIRGLDAMGNVALVGEDLRYSELTVTNGEVIWYIKIHDFNPIMFYWAGPGYVPAYHLLYRREGDPSRWTNVCSQPPIPSEDPQWQGGFETFALLIDDERYDRDKITVKPDDADAQGWFNIACAGTALAKMVLLHADPKLPPGHPYHTTKAQRTATLKMITADYFGTGQSFTQAKQPLWWTSAMGWHPLKAVQNDSNPEAAWTETGARCLTAPRLLNHPDRDVEAEIEAYRAAMELDPLPPCGAPAVPPAWIAGDVWHTYNAW